MNQVVDNIKAGETELSDSQFHTLLEASDQNPGSKTTLLGGWYPDNSSYEQIANKVEYNYYDMGSAYNNLNDKISGAGGQINVVWLDEKIKQGNDFVLSSSREEAGDSLSMEIDKLKENGYTFPDKLSSDGLYHIVKAGE
ncbi:MAG: hypothetical protein LBI13_00085 [Streptococcaceae bacterium]|jgi:hypothetical protein|nr:hypothetical protein [Streptococcaceae bacterium]